MGKAGNRLIRLLEEVEQVEGIKTGNKNREQIQGTNTGNKYREQIQGTNTGVLHRAKTLYIR